MSRGGGLETVIIVAHPDDESIWAGGWVLMHPECRWRVISLCRGSDPDRAPRFFRALEALGARGGMADLNDDSHQPPLPEESLREAILSLLPQRDFDLILTHGPWGEYTRHRRHEEVSRSVWTLWEEGSLRAPQLWMFAYGDSGKGGMDDLPGPVASAHRLITLPDDIWAAKYRIITEIYGFDPRGYEANIVQRQEAFWCFRTAAQFHRWLKGEAGSP